jgi:hypothetical protein
MPVAGPLIVSQSVFWPTDGSGYAQRLDERTSGVLSQHDPVPAYASNREPAHP